AFKNFFAEMDLSSWLNLLDDWKSCLQDDESLFELIVDYTPLKTYKKLRTLHEACIISYYWAETDYPPPNHHLIVDYLSSDYVDGYRYASPFEWIGSVFYEKNYVDIRLIFRKTGWIQIALMFCFVRFRKQNWNITGNLKVYLTRNRKISGRLYPNYIVM